MVKAHIDVEVARMIDSWYRGVLRGDEVDIYALRRQCLHLPWQMYH
jgi:hypothetical protein